MKVEASTPLFWTSGDVLGGVGARCRSPLTREDRQHSLAVVYTQTQDRRRRCCRPRRAIGLQRMNPCFPFPILSSRIDMYRFGVGTVGITLFDMSLLEGCERRVAET